MKCILAAATLAAFLSTHASAEDDASAQRAIEVAEAYLAAYSTFDVDKMAPFYADDVVFSDPTSIGQIPGHAGFVFEGKDAVIKGLGDYAAGYQKFSVKYDLERRYESAGVVVFVANLTFEAETKDGKKFTGANPIVTAVTVKDGKVSRHTDYYDYRENAVEF
ncbi:MAG: nuclear transport factor 2 family protein [Parvularculaceae bacterium]